jgi:hypothetical protein
MKTSVKNILISNPLHQIIMEFYKDFDQIFNWFIENGNGYRNDNFREESFELAKKYNKYIHISCESGYKDSHLKIRLRGNTHHVQIYKISEKYKALCHLLANMNYV